MKKQLIPGFFARNRIIYAGNGADYGYGNYCNGDGRGGNVDCSRGRGDFTFEQPYAFGLLLAPQL